MRDWLSRLFSYSQWAWISFLPSTLKRNKDGRKVEPTTLAALDLLPFDHKYRVLVRANFIRIEKCENYGFFNSHQFILILHFRFFTLPSSGCFEPSK